MDFPANRSTTGVLTIGEDLDGTFQDGGAQCGCGGERDEDIDWYRVNLEAGKTYLFSFISTGTYGENPPLLRAVNNFGFEEDQYDRFGDTWMQFMARTSGTHYISARQGSLSGNFAYLIASEEFKDTLNGDTPLIRVQPGFKKVGLLEPAKLDRFQVTLYEGRTYSFSLRGLDSGNGTLRNPHLQLWTKINGQLLIQNADSGIGRDSFFKYTPASDATYELRVSGNQTTGSYTLWSWVVDTEPVGVGTSSFLSFDSQGLASTSGYISYASDIDWHAVHLEQGQLVRVTLQGEGDDPLRTPSMIFRGPNNQVINAQYKSIPGANGSTALRYNYEVPTTGTYYVVARTNRPTYIGGYSASVEILRTPINQLNLFGRGMTPRVLTIDPADIALADLFHTQGFAATSYDVFAAFALDRNGVSMAALQVYSIPANELGLWKITERLDGQEDLFVRAKVSDSWSKWAKFPVFGTTPFPSLDSGQHWASGAVTYEFVDSLPAYYGANEFNSFEAIAKQRAVGRRIRDALASFSESSGLQFELVTSGNADINIFLASGFADPALAFLPGADRGGDIVFNSDVFDNVIQPQLWSDKYKTILRAVGRAVGLANVNDMDQSETVMGTDAPSGSNPIGPATYDLLALADIYGTSVFDPTDTQAFNEVWITATRSIDTIAVEAKGISVDPAVAAGGVQIDLRDGQRSFVRDASIVASEVYIGIGAAVYEASGFFGDDVLYGNGLQNTLRGGDGDDFLIGYEQFDVLLGGRGNDIYIHYFGDGRDYISDTAGRDTLCFFGRDGFQVDDLADDYTFTRHGNILTVNLTLDGRESEGQVDINLGSSGNGLIESLELWHGTDFSARLSLVSLVDQLSDGQTARFAAVNTSDEFGNLVSII